MTKYICEFLDLCDPAKSSREFRTIKEAKDWGRANTENGSRFQIKYQTDSTSGIIWRQRVL